MSTQLRLVEPPEPRPRAAASAGKAAAKAGGKAAAKAARKAPAPGASGRGRSVGSARTARTARTGRRSASWGDWRLDAGTRRVGRAGVANARRALEAALEQELRAS